MSLGWEMAARLILAPLLVLSQPPWSELGMFLVRGGVSLVFVLSLRTLFRVWCVRRGGAGEHFLSGWVIPLVLAGVGLLLLCSPRWGVVDRLFTQADRVLMNGSVVGGHLTPMQETDWYRLFVNEDRPGKGIPPVPSPHRVSGVTTPAEGRINTPAGERGSEYPPHKQRRVADPPEGQ